MCTSCKELFFHLVALSLLVFGAGMAYHYLTNKNPIQDLENAAQGFWPTIAQFVDEGSQFNSTTPAEADRWNTQGSYGLSLQVLNALEDKWYPYFTTAVSQWDNGNPDVLTLTTTIVAVDPDCSQVGGVLKVCNGDYGDTQWLGINYAMVVGRYITASVALMNEYYLATDTEGRKQYTMCHEIGHGFGLPHTDEIFYNKDTGECMDYTNNPDKDMQPNTYNFVFLAQMYGTVNGPWNGDNGTTTTQSSVTDDGSFTANDDGTTTTGTANDDGATTGAFMDDGYPVTQQSDHPPRGKHGGRSLRKNPMKQNQESEDDTHREPSFARRRKVPLIQNMNVPMRVLIALEDIRAENERPVTFDNDPESFYQDNRRLLHQSESSISYEVDLGEGYSIRVKKLLASGY